jgi:hypothetical protein
VTRTADQISVLCAAALLSSPPPLVAARLREIRSSLEGPLCIAIVGRGKCGKSTLLNALVGEKVAATDVASSTGVATWYRDGLAHGVTATLGSGDRRPLQFRRDAEGLQIDFGGLAAKAIDRIDVSWPSSRLVTTTFLDTPGLRNNERLNDSSGRGALGLTGEIGIEVDAVIHVMQHTHRSDIAFLESFPDQSAAPLSAAGSIAVLSRADEIGGARPDALASAHAVAERYAADPRLRSRCADVVALAALLAEGAATLHEDEFRALLGIAEVPAPEFDGLLLSADRFVVTQVAGASDHMRQSLLASLGMFGVRFSVHALRSGRVSTTAQLAHDLIQASGVPRLTALIDEHFGRRTQQLKVRSAIHAMKLTAELWHKLDPVAARSLAAGVERIEISSSEIVGLRLLHLVASSAAELSDDERAEVRELTREDGPSRGETTANLGPTPAMLSRIAYWRVRAEDPTVSPALNEAAQAVVRLYEERISESHGSRPQAATVTASGLGDASLTADVNLGQQTLPGRSPLVGGPIKDRPDKGAVRVQATAVLGERQRLDTYSTVLLVGMCAVFVGTTALGLMLHSVVLPIEAIAAFVAAAFAQCVKGFVVAPTTRAIAEARKLLSVVAAIWAVTFTISSLISISALSLIDAALWLSALAFMKGMVSSMGRVVARP